MQQPFSLVDAGILGVYFLLVLGLGAVFFRRSQSSSAEFTTGGRRLPTWLCGLSIFATFLSSITFIGLPGKAFDSDWSPFVFSLSLPIAAVIAVVWFVPYYRQSADVSAYLMLEQRFGWWARLVASLSFLGFHIARMAIVMYLTGLPLAFIFQWDIRPLILLIGLSVIVYTAIGGIVAVMWADAFQAIVLTFGAIAAVVILLISLPEGPTQVWTIASQQTPHKFSLGSFDWRDWSRSTFFVLLAYGLFDNLRNFGVDQSYIQRFISARTDAAARRSVWLSVGLYLPVSALFLFIGTSLFAFYQQQPAQLADLQQVVANRTESSARSLDSQANSSPVSVQVGNSVFPHFIANSLPTGLKGLLVAAILSAAMSTVSTSLNSCATIILSDFYGRLWRPDANESQRLVVLRSGTVLLGLLGTGGAFALIRLTESVLDVWWAVSSVLGAGILGLVLLSLLVPRARTREGAVAFACGGGVILWMLFSQAPWWPTAWQSLRSTFDPKLIVVFGSLTIVSVGCLMTQFRPRSSTSDATHSIDRSEL